jgi:hypothetical protein
MLKTTSGFSPTIDLSNNIAFSRSQSRATVPLKKISFRVLLGAYGFRDVF